MPPIFKKLRQTPQQRVYNAARINRFMNRRARMRPSKGLKLQISNVLKGKQETKLVIGAPFNRQTGTDLEQFQAFTTAITSTNEVYCLIPKTQQGEDDFNRIGNIIQPVSLTTKVNLAINPTDPSSQSIYADVWFLTAKSVKAERNSNQILTDKLFNDGQGTNVPYDGTSYTAMLPINKSEFTVISHKRVKLQKALDDPNTKLTGGVTASTNTFLYTSSLSVKIPVPTRYVYEDKVDDTPTNAFPFMMVGFVGTDTTGDSSSLTGRVYVQAQSHLYFKDS